MKKERKHFFITSVQFVIAIFEDFAFYFSDLHDESFSMTDQQLLAKLKSNYKNYQPHTTCQSKAWCEVEFFV